MLVQLMQSLFIVCKKKVEKKTVEKGCCFDCLAYSLAFALKTFMFHFLITCGKYLLNRLTQYKVVTFQC